MEVELVLRACPASYSAMFELCFDSGVAIGRGEGYHTGGFLILII